MNTPIVTQSTPVSSPGILRHATSIHGADVRQVRPHWRGAGHLRTLELELEGGDIVLLDPFALRLRTEVQARLQASRA